MLLIDRDDFKILSARLGHAVGDDALIRWLNNCSRWGVHRHSGQKIGCDKLLIV
ncbi:hypothetical protein [Rhodococcus erythropolis]|uniref:hypothetical protein n=1 Tax=Rhodococcus erythropolis TaxID=1833 RepID=UPI0038226DC6